MSVKEKKIPHFFISIYPPLLCVCVSLFNKLSKLWITKEAWLDKMQKKKKRKRKWNKRRKEEEEEEEEPLVHRVKRRGC